MKFSLAILATALFAQVSIAAWGLNKAIYDKWHQTELERWLADNDVPYPTASDRKDLENLVKDNWEKNVVAPYQSWDPQAQTNWLKQKGIEVTDKQAQNKDWLVNTIKKNWYETEAKVDETYSDVKSWIFDTWTESQLKSFLDYHNIPNPSPRTRDSLLSTARSNYASIANKAGETASYPGDWLYQAWSDSDLKAWLDYNGYPAPQTSSRDKLIASIRRNSRLAGYKLQDTKDTVADKIFDSWSDSDLKEWFDKNNIAAPQNGKRDELIALARKNRASLTGDTYSASVSSAYNAATTGAGNIYSSLTDAAGSTYAQATDAAAGGAQYVIDATLNAWSDSRLKAFLDSRGIPVPQNSKRDELLALARLHKYKAQQGYGAWTFDTWTVENLKQWLSDNGLPAKENDREKLSSSASSAYYSASSSGGNLYASMTNSFAKATDNAKATTFDTWSDSDIKYYLDSYGIPTYQGSTRNEMLAKAREYHQAFTAGFTQESAFERFQRQGYQAYSNIMQYLGVATADAKAKASAASRSASASLSSASVTASSAAASAAKSAASLASSAASKASKSASSASKEL